MHIGEALRLIRCRQGLTQEFVAFEVGFATSNLSRLEKGEQAVTLDRLLALAAALKVKASDIVKMIEVPATGNDRQLKEVEAVYDNDMQALHRAYRVLDDHHRMIGLLMLQDLARAQRAAK
ncbi:helix-turn-helix domain-containing protein [Pigmentiphaga litoralis]|uniref:helix-turn-helix domain-containing protein n=1 Tax=Pigmentiphaga litoralis TaxID=516702 RepID=UPI003B43AC79